jgi:hypothetical protein
MAQNRLEQVSQYRPDTTIPFAHRVNGRAIRLVEVDLSSSHFTNRLDQRINLKRSILGLFS